MALIKSWVKSANTSQTDFPLNNLPYGVFTISDSEPHCCVAIGDMVLDVTLLEAEQILIPKINDKVFDEPYWNSFMELGPESWQLFRNNLTNLLKQNPDDAKNINKSILKKFINSNFKDHPGNTDKFWFPTTRKDANKWLDEFFKERIKLFGDYEDAVTDKSNTVFHSALSPLVNLGLITPEEIITKLKKVENKVPMNSLEGYVRQIIGWREFMRGIYQNYDQRLEKTNFFNHNRKMKKSWYEGTTGLDPLDHAINNAKDYGWSHHIERLMILANIMNLCEINPKQVYKWFMEMFVDSSDWVMAPNIYGMGLFSDGGIFATKPYICGSSYFLKMMHFKKGPWCDVMDGLYWKFIDGHKKFFLKNPRLAMMVRISEKMNKERKMRIFKAANNFIKENTNG